VTASVSSVPRAARQALERPAKVRVGFGRGETVEVSGCVDGYVRRTVGAPIRRLDAGRPHEHAQAGGTELAGSRREQLCLAKAQLSRERLMLHEQTQLALVIADDVAQAPELLSEHAAQAPLQCDEAFRAGEHCAEPQRTIRLSTPIGRQQLLGPEGAFRTTFQ